MTIFISYARKDRAAAETLRHDLERARRPGGSTTSSPVGRPGGRRSSADPIVRAFRVRAEPRLLRSKACQAELRYALDLKRPLLPVMVRTVSVQLAPAAIADTQIIDYTERTADSAVNLVTAAANRPPPAPALPDPLPVPPPPPMSYMNPYREQIQSSDLSFRDQAQIVLALRWPPAGRGRARHRPGAARRAPAPAGHRRERRPRGRRAARADPGGRAGLVGRDCDVDITDVARDTGPEPAPTPGAAAAAAAAAPRGIPT